MNPYRAPEPSEPAESSATPQGYLPPRSVYAESIPQFTLENDPLVNDSRLGVSGWFAKAGGVLRRGFGPLLLIFAVTHFVPSAVLALLSAGGVLGLLRFGWNRMVSTEAAAGGIVLVVGLIVVAVLVQMAGYAAATYLSTLQAAGQRVRVGDALRYGLRRCLGLGGWMTLTALLAGGMFTVVALIHLPLTVLVFSGILATYAERRGDEGYTTTDLIRRLSGDRLALGG